MCTFQGWFTPLIVFPISITISTPSFAEPRRPKMGLNLFKFSIMLVNCRSNAVKAELEAYSWSWVEMLEAIQIAYLGDNPELQSWNCIDEIHLEVPWEPWVYWMWSRQKLIHIWFPSVILKLSVSNKSSNLMKFCKPLPCLKILYSINM